MRRLHVVALSPDGKSLLLAGNARSKKPTYRIALDGKLKSALRNERPPSPPAPEEPNRRESSLTPREIQARLRAGATVAEVAKAAGVPAERVERFFGPVESERIQILDAAQSTTMDRPRWGESARPLGEAVAMNLTAVASLRTETVSWTARRRPDGCWVVRVDFIARARRRVAEWEWSPREHTLIPLDSFATTLGYVEPRGGAPGRRSSSTTRARATTRRTATPKKTAKKAAKKTAKRATAKSARKTVKATKKSARKSARQTTRRTSTARSRSTRRR